MTESENVSTKFVKAIIPVLGLRVHQVVELVDSPYLRKVIERGWLELVTKAEAKKTGAANPVVPQAVDPQITNAGVPAAPTSAQPVAPTAPAPVPQSAPAPSPGA